MNETYEILSMTDSSNFCCICQGIWKNPVMCSNCKNMFCKSCISGWTKEKSICPFKCTENRLKLVLPTQEKMIEFKDLRVRCQINECNKVGSFFYLFLGFSVSKFPAA